MTPGDLTARLLATFRAELDEQLRTMSADLLALEAAPDDAERLKSLFRGAHTLKGAAHAAGVPEVERTCHRMEARLAAARDEGARLRSADFATLFSELDRLGEAAAGLRPDSPAGADEASQPATRPADADSPGPKAAPARADETKLTQVRVDESKLDAVLATAAELLVTAGNVEAILAQVGQSSKAARAEARRLSQLSAAVRANMLRLRLRPFGEACEPLPRLVRDLLASSQKQVALHLEGTDVEADRAVLDGLREALLHLVRNAIDHGIEMPEARARAGKPRAGRIDVTASIRGDRLLVTVTDDGAGVDLPALRAKLARHGVAAPEDARQWSRLLLQGGLSSRTEATVISGRGVGLDAARAAVERVGGEIDVTWQQGEGTTFRIDVPLTLALQRLVIVSIADHLVAFPSADVERMDRVALGELRRLDGHDVLPDPAGPLRVVSLGALLGPGFGETARSQTLTLVRLRAPRGRLALVVDALVSEEEALIRSLERMHRPGTQVAGVALLGGDRIALVMRTSAIVDAGLDAAGADASHIHGFRDEPARRVLVVDDSITTRTLEKNVLETAGYEVTTAHDGAEAWRLLQEREFDAVLSDVEMPRMDGFDLCRAIRSAKRTEELPVVLLTALESPAQRARGLELGADGYLVKSSFDQNELLEILRQLTGAPA